MTVLPSSRPLKIETYKVGDKVRVKPVLNFDQETVKPNKTYEISEVCFSPIFGDYVQLKGVHSSFCFDWIEHAEK